MHQHSETDEPARELDVALDASRRRPFGWHRLRVGTRALATSAGRRLGEWLAWERVELGLLRPDTPLPATRDTAAREAAVVGGSVRLSSEQLTHLQIANIL